MIANRVHSFSQVLSHQSKPNISPHELASTFLFLSEDGPLFNSPPSGWRQDKLHISNSDHLLAQTEICHELFDNVQLGHTRIPGALFSLDGDLDAAGKAFLISLVGPDTVSAPI